METPTGPICIEDVEVGDRIWSVDLQTGGLVARPVARRLAAMATELVTLRFVDYTMVECTPEHPIYESSQERWVFAGDIREGSGVLRLIDGDLVEMRVASVERRTLPREVEVFDLTIGGPEHNFIAGGILVHNKSEVVPPGETEDTDLDTGLDTAVDTGLDTGTTDRCWTDADRRVNCAGIHSGGDQAACAVDADADELSYWGIASSCVVGR